MVRSVKFNKSSQLEVVDYETAKTMARDDCRFCQQWLALGKDGKYPGVPAFIVDLESRDVIGALDVAAIGKKWVRP